MKDVEARHCRGDAVELVHQRRLDIIEELGTHSIDAVCYLDNGYLCRTRCPRLAVQNYTKNGTSANPSPAVRPPVVGRAIFATSSAKSQFSIFNSQLGLGPCQLRVNSVSGPCHLRLDTDQTRIKHGQSTGQTRLKSLPPAPLPVRSEFPHSSS